MPRPTPGTHRRGDASVFRSAPRRDGTPARFGSAIVTREASPGALACFIDHVAGVAKKHDTGTHRRGEASVFRSAPHRDGTPARFGSAIVTREASPGALACFTDHVAGVAIKHDTGTHRRGEASFILRAPHRDGTPARFGSLIDTRAASPGALACFIDHVAGVAKKHDTGTHRRGEASVFRSAPHRDGTQPRFGSAIVTREASPVRSRYRPRKKKQHPSHPQMVKGRGDHAGA